MSEDRKDKGEEISEVQRKMHPSSIANLKPWKPGQSGNPEGRKTMGAYLREELNSFAIDEELSEDKLRKIARDPKAHPRKRAAAVRCLRMIELPDMADFSGLLRGENNLEELRAMGINTELVKKFEQTTRKSPIANGEIEEVIHRKLELHDRSGEDFDRVANNTDGTPVQTVRAEIQRGPKDGFSSLDELPPEVAEDVLNKLDAKRD